MEIHGCTLRFDLATNTVTICHRKNGTNLMQIKLESGSEGTMARITPEQDCDNFWIGLKPADNFVFQTGLFSRKRLVVQQFKCGLV